MASPAVVPSTNNFAGLDWRTAILGEFDPQSVSGPLANLRAHTTPHSGPMVDQMSTNVPNAPAQSSSQVANRMRLYRQRRRQGLRSVRLDTPRALGGGAAREPGSAS